MFVAALWSDPEELPEFPHQTPDRNHFSCRYHHGKMYNLSLFDIRLFFL